MDNRIDKYRRGKYRNVINVLLGTSLYDNIFADHYRELENDIVKIKVSGLYLEQGKDGNLRRKGFIKMKEPDVTAVIDRRCNIVIEECWTKSDIYGIRKARDKILKCKELRIHKFGWYRLFNPYLFILKGDDIKYDVIITPSTKPESTGIWKIVECYIDDFEDKYKEYYLRDKTQNRRSE